MAFWCAVLTSNLAIYHSNIGVQLSGVIAWNPHTLMYVDRLWTPQLHKQFSSLERIGNFVICWAIVNHENCCFHVIAHSNQSWVAKVIRDSSEYYLFLLYDHVGLANCVNLCIWATYFYFKLMIPKVILSKVKAFVSNKRREYACVLE